MSIFHSSSLLLLAAAAAIVASHLRPLSSASRLVPVDPGDAVVVTGTSSGIGKHAALSLARDGFVVFACVRKTDDGDALIRSAEQFGVDPTKIRPIILDVTNSEHISRGVEAVTSFVGERGLKGLFNNAGIGDFSVGAASKSTATEHMEMMQYRKVFDVNFFGLVQVTKAFLELLRKGRGRIVMNTSVAGFLASPFMSAYASSKHAVEGFSDSLRREMHEHGVKVSVIEPGYIETPLINGFVPEGASPYTEAERSYWTLFWIYSIGASTPKVTSEAVLHAMKAREPYTRYVVGKDSTMLKIMKLLPTSWIDAMLRRRFRGSQFGEDEVNQLLKASRTEFTLD